MWIYEKKLIYPMPKLRPDAHMAKLVNALMGGANGEMSAATTYLNQRYCMPYKRVQALLTDIGTEELSHVEMLSSYATYRYLSWWLKVWRGANSSMDAARSLRMQTATFGRPRTSARRAIP